MGVRFTRIIMTGLFLFIVFSNVGFANANQIEFTATEREFIEKHPVIRLGADPQFVPYEFFDTDGQYKGIAADYIKLLSERTGLKLETEKDITWAEAYEKAVERKLDVLPCISKTKEREPFFLFSKPYYSFQRVIVVKDSNKNVTELEDLFNKQVAVKKGSSHHSYLKAFSAIEFSLYPTEEAAISAVADGRETYFVGNLATSSYLIKGNGFTNLKYIQINSEEPQYLYFAVRQDWPELISIINKGLDSITEAEKIDINNKWIGIENQADYSEIIKIIAIVSGVILVIFLVSLYWIIKLRREVAERLRVEAALKVAKEEAEVANNIKSTFLARMSHEIRTPLNAITGMAYLIKKTDITTTQRIYLDKITQASRNMLGIINDILDFSKIEAGKIELERVSFNIDKVLQQVISIVSFHIEEQGIDFYLNKDPHIPVNFWGDPTRLAQILLNLINNAVKFTTQGQVAVRVRLVAIEKDMFHLEFSVKDNGIGMSDEQLSQLFKPFDQGDSTINRRFGGTGLGLSIVKSLVEMMGGEIRACSNLGEGSTFTINLALEVDREKEDADKEKTASIYFENIRVLVLEKSTTHLNLLRDYLNSFNMAADFTSSEAQAIEILGNTINNDENSYDLLIVDNETPNGGGIEFAKRIREESSIAKKPKIILMIPLMREDLFEKIEDTDIDFGITKPIIASVLFNGIIQIFGDKVLAIHDRLANSDPTNNFIVDYPYHVLIVEDNKTNQFIARSILEQAGFKVSLSDNGKTGFEFYGKHQTEIDLILMDLHMPVLNGYEATALIRELNASLPIVAMTADAITGVEEQCQKVGIDYYISKPFDPEEFVATIWNVLKTIPKERKEIEHEEAEINELDSNPEVILDENEGLRLLGNNRDLYLMVLDEYYRENKDVLAMLSNSINARQYQEAVQIMHKVKSSSGNIGAKRLFAIASELQKSLTKEDKAEIIRLHKQFQLAFSQLIDEIVQKIPNSIEGSAGYES